jgi:ankyrin repeat protein
LAEQYCKLTLFRFLLARLHTDSLLDKRKPREVKLTLAKLKKGEAALNSAYSDALQRIEGQLDNDCKLAKDVLSWITLAKRPLTTAELCCALAVEPGEAELDPENKPDVDDIVSVCAGLVVVDQESAIIRLVHYTTQEYFERISSRLNPDGELEIAETCLTYLSFSVFESGSCTTDEEFEERLCQHEFLDYAAKHCGEHIRSVEAKVAHLACTLVIHSGIFSCAAQVLFAPSYKYRGYRAKIPAVTGLHWIARFGLCDAAKEFLRREEDETCAVNAMDSNGEGSLMYAVKHGHCAMAELLLDKGADVNAQGGGYGNALQAASSKGHEAVVKLLLDKGADVNAQGGEDGNALQAASSEGHEAVVKLLLDKGADINAQGGFYGNALQAASFRGHEAVVKLLLDKGADVNAQGGRYGNALQAASFRGHEAVVILLLDKGADVNAQSGRYGNALQAASSEGHEAVVKLLLDKGADVNAQGRGYGNALHAAAYAGNNELLERLIRKDSVTQSQDPYDRTLLWWAAAGGQTTTVQLLISRYNYDSRTTDKFGRTPLWIATKKGHHAVSELLSEECGPTDPGQTASPDYSDDSGSIQCDVCTSSIRACEFHHHCRYCSNGDWDVCEDCRVRGAFCAEETHILVKRVKIDGKWVEMTC